MAQEQKSDNPNERRINVDAEGESTSPKEESEVEDEQDEATPSAEAGSSSTATKKKKSKRKRIKAALMGRDENDKPTKDNLSKAVSGLSKAQVSELLAMNPALAKELGVEEGDIAGSKAADALKRLSMQDIMTGLAAGGKNVKDMASYKFWQTQPVPRLDDKKEDIVEGPFKLIDPGKVSKEPGPLLEGFEWVTMDLTTDKELKEVHELLNGHYVEDKEAMFRFSYSEPFLRWYIQLAV
jgi:glycylpeptide N-tetradecanoyltransferase